MDSERGRADATDHRLLDGTIVRTRPLRADDKARLVEALRRLSARSRYLRFLGAVNELSEATLRYLTEVDQKDHIAVIALDPRAPGEPAVGVARCVRVRAEPSVAEVAVTVADDHQDRGLGSLLLELLAEAALARGVATFRAVVLRENEVILHALQEVGLRGHLEDGAVHVDVPVEEVRELARAYRTGGGEPLRG